MKEFKVVTDRICWGSPFHNLAAAYLKDLSPYVFVLVLGSINCTVLLDRRDLDGIWLDEFPEIAWSNAQ